MPETPFYLWSLAEAWQWVVNIPGMGFGLLVVVVFFVCVFGFRWLDRATRVDPRLVPNKHPIVSREDV